MEGLGKIHLQKGKLPGSFEGAEQHYNLNYMPHDERQNPQKIELSINLMVNGKYDGEYRSLRFTNNVQLMEFITSLVHAYIFLGKKKETIVDANYQFKKDDFIKKLNTTWINYGKEKLKHY